MAIKTPEQWLNQFVGYSLDFDGAYGAQCADLAEFYNRDYIGAPRIGGHAYEMFDRASSAYYQKIENTPSAVPKEGDIMIWKKTDALPYGHVAIVSYTANVNSFISYDQNWPIGSVVHRQSHNYTSPPVRGWLRPKNRFWATPAPAPTPPPVTPTPPTIPEIPPTAPAPEIPIPPESPEVPEPPVVAPEPSEPIEPSPTPPETETPLKTPEKWLKLFLPFKYLVEVFISFLKFITRR